MKWSIGVARGIVAAAVLFSGSALAQLYGTNPFNNTVGSEGLFRLDRSTGAIVDEILITAPGFNITGAQGITRDPTTGQVYAILRAAAVAGRLLARIDVHSGASVVIGNLGDNFSSISFRGDGQLFGITGDGAAVPSTLYLVDKATATSVQVQTLGNGADGEVIAYHPPSNSFFHWSRGVFERISANAPYTVTNVPITGPVGDEIFGAVWDPSIGQFLVHNIASSMDFWTSTGVRSNPQPATTDDVRGMALLLPAIAGVNTIPTLGEWGMLILALLMAAAAINALRGRSTLR